MSESPPPKNPPATKRITPGENGEKPAADQPQRRTPAKKQRKGGQVGLMLLILVVAAGAAGGGFFLWHSLQTVRQQLSAGHDTLRQQLAALQQRTDQVDQQVKANQALASDIQALKTQQQTLEDTIATLRNQRRGDRRVWDIKEIATLLQIANDRLHLERAVAPSLAALEAADRHLQALNNPALLEVRRKLAADISALRSTPTPDISGMALSLDALIQGIDRLPIAGTVLQPQTGEAATTAKPGWRGVLHDLWQKLKSLVSIHHQGEAERPLLAPDQRYFLRQNLRLDLEAARVALLRRDGQTYRRTLQQAQEWLGRYFDNNAAPTAAALQELAHLQQTDIAPNLPDISGSLNALRAWLAQQQARQTEPAPETTQP